MLTVSGGLCSVNESVYGLQAGIFTHDMDKAFYAFETLEVRLFVVSPLAVTRASQGSNAGVLITIMFLSKYMADENKMVSDRVLELEVLASLNTSIQAHQLRIS